MRAKFILFVFISLYLPVVIGDSFQRVKPKPFILASKYSPYYVTMLPEPGDGYGVAYKLLEDGTSVELWRIDRYIGGYLSSDGQHLARVSSALQPGHGPYDEIAIEFFRSGVLFNSYLISDLVKDTSMIRHTVSQYIWMPIDINNPYLRSNNTLYLQTIDGIHYYFDLASGEIIESNPP